MRRTAAVAALLFIAVLVSRAPFGAQTLWAHDSVLYARAIEQGFHVDHDLRNERPHAPGYILYVGSADLVHHAGGLGSNEALILVSMVASALGAAALFLLARRHLPEWAALVAGAAYAANPLVWQYSDVAMPYAVLGLGSIAVAWAGLWARGRGMRRALVATVVFGVAAGFRQDLLILLAPLWLWCVWPLGIRRVAVLGASLVAVCITWLVPTVLLSGGPADYLMALRSQAGYVSATYSVVAQGTPALLANAAMTVYALGWGTLLVAPLAVAAALVTARRAWRRGAIDEAAFSLVWCVPPILVYAMLHIGDWGYVLSALPGVYVLAARLVARAGEAAGPRRQVAVAASWATLVALPALVFVATSAPFSASSIASHDHELLTRFTYVRDQYAAERTLILTREDFLLVRYYLPAYPALQYDPEPYVRGSRRIRAGKVDRIVVFTPGLSPQRAADVRRVACAKGIEFVYLDVVPGTVLEFSGERYAVAPPPFMP